PDLAQFGAFEEGCFETARPSVEGENPHAGSPLHFQSFTSGRSSPCTSIYCLCSISLSRSHCLKWPPTQVRRGTRSTTSPARWKRSRSFSTVMSNGVVVVPSSL